MMNSPVLLYGAGESAILEFHKARRLIAPRIPEAFIDGDAYKRVVPCLGMPVLSFDEAVRRFGKFDVYVTAGEKTAPNVIGFLLEKGFGEDRIINYEPIEKHIGCTFAETYIAYDYESSYTDTPKIRMRSCCLPVSEMQPAILNETGLEGLVDFIELKYDIADELRKGFSPHCKPVCPYIREQYFYKERKIRRVGFGGAPCQFSCVYCVRTQLPPYGLSAFDSLANTFNKLESLNVIHPDFTVVDFAAGEFALAGADYQRLVRKYRAYIFTNAYKYSPEAAKAIESGGAYLNVSVDSGTKETFRKVKGVDGFEKVSKHLAIYASKGLITLKYIVCDGVNDTSADLDGFVNLASNVAFNVVLSRDYTNKTSLSSSATQWCEQFVHKFQQLGKMGAKVHF
jgi:sulfatase maturation enzyme AslB (radical SAM superfamily)